MGGLLDKANAAKESDDGTKAEAQVAEPKPVKASTSPQPQQKAVSTSSTGGPDAATKFSLAGWVVILLGAILSLQGGAWGFAVVSVVLVL